VICLLSLVGVPPLAGFFGKLLLFAVALDAGFGWLVSSANSVLSLAVYMRLLATAYQRPADTRMPSLSVVAAACTVIVVGLGLMYDTVLQLDAEQSTKPLLATDVKASQDGTAYEITVRSGVRWHDGKPLTADDVKFTYEYFLANTQGQFTTSLLAPRRLDHDLGRRQVNRKAQVAISVLHDPRARRRADHAEACLGGRAWREDEGDIGHGRVWPVQAARVHEHPLPHACQQGQLPRPTACR